MNNDNNESILITLKLNVFRFIVNSIVRILQYMIKYGCYFIHLFKITEGVGKQDRGNFL